MILYKIKEPEFEEHDNGMLSVLGLDCWWELYPYQDPDGSQKCRARKYRTATRAVVWTKYMESREEAESAVAKDRFNDVSRHLEEVVIK